MNQSHVHGWSGHVCDQYYYLTQYWHSHQTHINCNHTNSSGNTQTTQGKSKWSGRWHFSASSQNQGSFPHIHIANPTAIILCLPMRPANEIQHCSVTSSLIGWVHMQKDPCPIPWLPRSVYVDMYIYWICKVTCPYLPLRMISTIFAFSDVRNDKKKSNISKVSKTRTTTTPAFWDTPHRPMITHTSGSHQIPSQNKTKSKL